MDQARKRFLFSLLISIFVSPALIMASAGYLNRTAPVVIRTDAVPGLIELDLSEESEIEEEVPETMLGPVRTLPEKIYNRKKPEKPIIVQVKPQMLYIDRSAKQIVDLFKPDKEEIPDVNRFVSEFNVKTEKETRAKITSKKPSRKNRKTPKIGMARTKKAVLKEKGIKGEVRERAREGNKRKETISEGKDMAGLIDTKKEPTTDRGKMLADLGKSVSRIPGDTEKPGDEKPDGDLPGKVGEPGKAGIKEKRVYPRGESPVAKSGADGDEKEGLSSKNIMPTLAELDEGLGRDAEPENFLPFIKPGMKTVLNAKTYRFGSFVRRVHGRIHNNFVVRARPSEWTQGSPTQIGKGPVIEAVINMNGRLVSTRYNRRSGNKSWDSMALSAVKKGAWDSNVPEGAQCEDGFVHLYFNPQWGVTIGWISSCGR